MRLIHVCIYFMIASILLSCQQHIEGNEARQEAYDVAEQATDPRENEMLSGQEISEHLVHLAERVPEVKRATAIVIGDLAVVGIDVNEQLDRSDVGVIKYEVAEALKDDPHGAYAFISADPDVNRRLTEMRKEINAGHPISGIMNELAAIVGRIIPIVPGPEHEAQDPEPTNANDDRLSEGQSDELENIQEEQGKRNMDDENLDQPNELEKRRNENENN